MMVSICLVSEDSPSNKVLPESVSVKKRNRVISCKQNLFAHPQNSTADSSKLSHSAGSNLYQPFGMHDEWIAGIRLV